MSDIQAAYLWGQLEKVDEINQARLTAWKIYFTALTPIARTGCFKLPAIPVECTHNAHMFYLKTSNLKERSILIAYLKERGIWAVFHYVPLHSAVAGKKFGRFHGQDNYTTLESDRLIRLPLWFGISSDDQAKVIAAISEFYA